MLTLSLIKQDYANRIGLRHVITDLLKKAL